MPFLLTQSASVAVGTFNIYVFQPADVGRITGLADNSHIEAEGDYSRPGFRWLLGTTTWTVRPDRVTIETNSPSENCGLVLSRILDWLPVTPISALGHNFKYIGQIDDLPIAAEMTAMIPQAEPRGLVIKQRSCHIGFQRDDITFNLQVAVRGNEVELLANVHLQPPENPGRDEDSQKSIFAKRFLDFRSEVAELLITSLGVQIR